MRDEQNPSSSHDDVPAPQRVLDVVDDAVEATVEPLVERSVTLQPDAGAEQEAASVADTVASESNAPSATGPRSGPVVATLTSARMPADHGISGLALLMQLGGVIGIVFGVLMALSTALGGAGPMAGPFFMIAVTSCIRSTFHRAAGTTLLYGTGEQPARSMRTYLWVSLGHTLLCLLILKSYFDSEFLFKVGALLIGWPAALFVFFNRKQIKDAIADGVPHAEDYGFEGASVLMTLFGIMGTLVTGLFLQAVLGKSEAVFATTAGGIMMLVLVALVARSVIQTIAGLKGISGAELEERNIAASRYYNFGVMSSVCIGVTFFVVIFMASQSMLWAMLFGGVSTVLLLAWPQIVRRLYSERNFHVYLAGSDAQTFQRAPDAGLIALGWTLVAVSLFGLGVNLADALWHEPLSAVEFHMLLSYGGSDAVEQAMRSPWWAVGVGMLQLWAGIELIRMSERHKIAAMVYGVASIAVIAYLVWPMVDSMENIFKGLFGSAGAGHSIVLMATSVPLVFAIGTIVLVNRTTIPSAVVHTRRHKPGAGHASHHQQRRGSTPQV